MRISRLGLPLAVALLAVVGLLLCEVLRTCATECKLPDGSALRLEKITYGKCKRVGS